MSQNLKIYTANICGTATRFDVMPETRTVIVNGVTYTEDECVALAAMMRKALEYLDEDEAPEPTGEMLYPPCDLRGAESGDIVECWDGEKAIIDFLNASNLYCFEATVLNSGDKDIEYRDFSLDGIFWRVCHDSQFNARFLHKKPAQGMEESE